jgi:hypothetical protein
MMSYWVYQHLGNMSPEEIRRDGMLARWTAVPDGTALLRAWAIVRRRRPERPGRTGSASCATSGAVRLVMWTFAIHASSRRDCRRLVADHEWEWVRERCSSRASTC